MRPTSQETQSSAAICRERRWVSGIELQSGSIIAHDRQPSLRIRLTAVGRKVVLGELVAIDGLVVDGAYGEACFDLRERDWEPV